MQFSRRSSGITSFKAMDILAAAVELQAQGRDIIRMEVGEPAFPTPQPVVEAAQQALASGFTKYTASLWYSGVARGNSRALPAALWCDGRSPPGSGDNRQQCGTGHGV